MNFDRRASWPHPVIAPNRDDVASDTAFEFDITAVPNGNDWVLSFNVSHNDPCIDALIGNGSASYLLYLECPESHFRQTFATTNTTEQFSVPARLLSGDTEARAIVVAARDIARYQHPRQHADYRNASFSISVGEPLAISAARFLPLSLDSDPVLQLSSIFDVQKDHESVRSMTIDLWAERILIKLPEDDYERYSNMYAAPKLRDLLSSTVLFPALLQALHFLRELESDGGLDDFRVDHRWCRTVIRSCASRSIDIFGDNDSLKCFTGAQDLLRGPLRRCLDNLNSIYDLG